MSQTTSENLDRAALHQARLTAALANNAGNRAWREWKAAEAAAVVALADKAPRMEVLDMDLSADLNIAYRIDMPVPRWPVEGKLVIGDTAVFHLHYQEPWRWESPPGWAPLGLFQPLDPFHPNMQPALRGAICLGRLPPGTPPKEIVLLGYYALSLQDRVLDETDPHGVLNVVACEYYRQHPECLPLTRAGLFDPWEGEN
jgi:hypothetical protein